MWLNSTCSWAWVSGAEVGVSCASLQLAIVTDGDRKKTVSDSNLISPNLSLSAPDKRAGLLAMIASGRIWKVGCHTDCSFGIVAPLGPKVSVGECSHMVVRDKVILTFQCLGPEW